MTAMGMAARTGWSRERSPKARAILSTFISQGEENRDNPDAPGGFAPLAPAAAASPAWG